MDGFARRLFCSDEGNSQAQADLRRFLSCFWIVVSRSSSSFLIKPWPAELDGCASPLLFAQRSHVHDSGPQKTAALRVEWKCCPLQVACSSDALSTAACACPQAESRTEATTSLRDVYIATILWSK